MLWFQQIYKTYLQQIKNPCSLGLEGFFIEFLNQLLLHHNFVFGCIFFAVYYKVVNTMRQ